MMMQGDGKGARGLNGKLIATMVVHTSKCLSFQVEVSYMKTKIYDEFSYSRVGKNSRLFFKVALQKSLAEGQCACHFQVCFGLLV
jgi:hypothetical protein